MKHQTLILLSLLACLALSNASTSHWQQTPTHHLTIQANHELRRSASGGSIFVGFFLGPLLFLCACICIWFNQKRAAIDSRRLNYANEICQPVDVTSQASAISKDGKLVYASGQSCTSAVIGEQLSGISGPNLIKISRQVQVLEWRKHTRRNGDYDETYYELEWVRSHQANQVQRYNNPAHWFINDDVTYNTQVFLGGYNIDKTTADNCHRQITFTPSIQHAQNIMRNTGKMDRQPSINGQYIYFSPNSPIGVGAFVQGYSPIQTLTNQSEGTLRVRYFLCPTGDITICAGSSSSSTATFTPFPIAEREGTSEQRNDLPDCCCCCISACYAQMLKPLQTIHLVEQALYTRQEMFYIAIKNSECFTRGVRIGCYILLVLSICMFFSPITTILGYIPLVGGLVSGIVGFAIFLAALIVSIPIFFLVTSVAWVRFRPKVGAALLIIGAGVLAFLLIYNNSKGGGAPTPTAAHFMTMRPLHI